MPKKTKKEKIIAELRRKLESAKTTDETISQPAPSSNYQLPTVKPTANHSIETNIITDVYFLQDLRKTFILSVLAIGLEFILYWLTELGGNKFL